MKCKCRFRVHVKSKPKRYGIKIFSLYDAKTHCLVNVFVYTGKNTHVNSKKCSTSTVLDFNSKRNVSGDNSSTSIELLEEL